MKQIDVVGSIDIDSRVVERLCVISSLSGRLLYPLAVRCEEPEELENRCIRFEFEVDYERIPTQYQRANEMKNISFSSPPESGGKEEGEESSYPDRQGEDILQEEIRSTHKNLEENEKHLNNQAFFDQISYFRLADTLQELGYLNNVRVCVKERIHSHLERRGEGEEGEGEEAGEEAGEEGVEGNGGQEGGEGGGKGGVEGGGCGLSKLAILGEKLEEQECHHCTFYVCLEGAAMNVTNFLSHGQVMACRRIAGGENWATKGDLQHHHHHHLVHPRSDWRICMNPGGIPENGAMMMMGEETGHLQQIGVSMAKGGSLGTVVGSGIGFGLGAKGLLTLGAVGATATVASPALAFGSIGFFIGVLGGWCKSAYDQFTG